MKFEECIQCAQRAVWVGVFSNGLLFFMKLGIGIISGSRALIADSLYSLKDVSFSIAGIIALRYSRKGLDAKHPYGHGKIEFLASLIISVFLIILAVHLAFDTIYDVFNKALLAPPHLIALVAAVIALLTNIFLYRYTKCVAKETNSPIIKTASRHNEADAFSSGLVAMGLLGTHFGVLILDHIVALLETLHIAILSIVIIKDSYAGLMDSSLPETTNNLIKKVTLKVGGVLSVQSLRTRQTGQEAWIEITIGVKPDIPVYRARGIAETVEDELLDNIPHLGHVLVCFTGENGSVKSY
ncbi:MAG: cation transporter [Candidatus Scalindua sediminis]|nr:cation transporter [Candidatus Scalindua sediminis]